MKLFAALAFLIAVACYLIVVTTAFAAVYALFRGELAEKLNGDGLYVVLGTAAYLLIGTVALWVGATLTQKTDHPPE